MDILNVYIIDRRTKETKDLKITEEFTITSDYLSVASSSFTLVGKPTAEVDDLILVKQKGQTNIIYLGVIDNINDNKILTYDMYVLADFTFPATYISGTSFETHAINLLTRYLKNDSNKLVSNLSIASSTNTPHRYQPKETPTQTNLLDYLKNAYRKYNITWTFDVWDKGILKTRLHKNIAVHHRIKNNVKGFTDWTINESERFISNKLVIYSKAMKSSESPIILKTFFLSYDNTIAETFSPKVRTPVKETSVTYDIATDELMALTPVEREKQIAEELLAIAETELKGNTYSHNITFNMQKDNLLVDYRSLQIGDYFTVIYNGKTYASVLSGYELSHNTDYIKIILGHIRYTIEDLI